MQEFIITLFDAMAEEEPALKSIKEDPEFFGLIISNLEEEAKDFLGRNIELLLRAALGALDTEDDMEELDIDDDESDLLDQMDPERR